jgi:PAT family beta-lactamase induction signal transducer AmpG
MLIKLTSPFLLDPVEKGGMGLPTDAVGVAYGTIGLIAMILGGILGGITIARLGFRSSIWVMALATNLPNAYYIYMAWALPGVTMVYLLVAVEQFGQGFGFTAFTVYLMYVSQGRYKTSHFAISTGIMAFGMMLPGAISGDLQTYLAKSDPTHAYLTFFIVVFVLTFPGFFTIPFILRSPQIDDANLPEEDPLAAPSA